MNTLTKTTKYENLSLTELKALVEGAKNGEVDATERLCNQFKYMIKEEVGKSYIRDTLGEDAENDAWVFFFEAVQNYKRKSMSMFPRFAKKYVHFKLLNLIFRSKHNHNTLSLDSFKDDYDVLEPADPKDYFEDVYVSDKVQRLLNLLTPKQKEVIIRSVIAGEKQSDIAKDLNKSFKTISWLRNIALNNLRNHISAEDLVL